MKRNEDSLRDLWDNIKHTNIRIIGVRERRQRERSWENTWRDNRWKLSEHGKGTGQPSPGSTESPRKDKPKEEHTKTHSNQTDKDRDKILKATHGWRSQDGRGVGRGDHLLSYRFIKRTIEHRANFTKQLLIASWGHQAPRKAAHCLRKEVGQNI